MIDRYDAINICQAFELDQYAPLAKLFLNAILETKWKDACRRELAAQIFLFHDLCLMR